MSKVLLSTDGQNRVVLRCEGCQQALMIWERPVSAKWAAKLAKLHTRGRRHKMKAVEPRHLLVVGDDR